TSEHGPDGGRRDRGGGREGRRDGDADRRRHLRRAGGRVERHDLLRGADIAWCPGEAHVPGIARSSPKVGSAEVTTLVAVAENSTRSTFSEEAMRHLDTLYRG